jgi:uncharacterized protein (TIGR02246 family)
MRRIATWGSAIAVLSVTLLQAQAGRNPEIQKTTDAFVSAWAKGDAKSLAALHAENAIRSTPEGLIQVGRSAIEKSFSDAFAGPLKGTTLVVKAGEERTINPDVVVASGTYEVSGGNMPPGAATKGIYVNTLVRQGGRWLVVSSAPVGVAAPPAKQP